MKKVLIHTLPVALSFIWLTLINHTFNPLILKGPDFLKFYLLLVSGFYASVLTLRFFKESVSQSTFSFITVIFLLGILKAIRGIFLGKPIGYLILILTIELIVFLMIKRSHLNHYIK